jgi:hypothetical protein
MSLCPPCFVRPWAMPDRNRHLFAWRIVGTTRDVKRGCGMQIRPAADDVQARTLGGKVHKSRYFPKPRSKVDRSIKAPIPRAHEPVCCLLWGRGSPTSRGFDVTAVAQPSRRERQGCRRLRQVAQEAQRSFAHDLSPAAQFAPLRVTDRRGIQGDPASHTQRASGEVVGERGIRLADGGRVCRQGAKCERSGSVSGSSVPGSREDTGAPIRAIHRQAGNGVRNVDQLN